ncbi:MAG: SCP2 sterol-binding domain-containing protein [Planctomycetaceae bacterium]
MVEHQSSVPSADRFRRILARTIVLLDEVVDHRQITALAEASATICWDFPDIGWQAWLVVRRNPPGLLLQAANHDSPALTVAMDSAVLHAAAIGETSLGTAFINGRLRVRGLSPLFLARFVRLVDPLLSSYRAALEEVHERAA